MAAESFAHRGQDLFGKGVLLTRAETRVERGGKDLGGDPFLERGLDGPAAFPGIFHVAGIGIEFTVARQSDRSEIKQPGGDNASAPPQFRDVGEVQIVRKSGGRLSEFAPRRMSNPSAYACMRPYSIPL